MQCIHILFDDFLLNPTCLITIYIEFQAMVTFASFLSCINGVRDNKQSDNGVSV